MNKNNTSLNLIHNFLSEGELKSILTEFHYVDTARKCTVSTVISYLIGAATHEWESLRHAADVGPCIGLVSVDHSSLSKHLKSLNYAIMKRIFEVIVGKLNRATRHTLKMPLQVVETTGLKRDGPIGISLEDKHFILFVRKETMLSNLIFSFTLLSYFLIRIQLIVFLRKAMLNKMVDKAIFGSFHTVGSKTNSGI